MDLGIRGRRAAIGASSGGLGLGSARALVADGVDVVLSGRSAGRLDEAVRDLSALGGGAVHGVEADVSTADGASAFIERAGELLGGIDILVANSGGPKAGGALDVSPTDFGPALQTSLLSAVAMVQAVVPDMRAQRWGRIVAITSVSVRQPIPGLVLSNAARAGLTGYLKTLAAEVAADGITVNTVQPGSHATDRLRSLHGDDLSGAAAGVPMRVLGRPEDFGSVVAFLCSDQARFVTGVSIPVDGGANQALL
jgi:3-oxoacyl-[acyl-carrier protein] reductase